MLLFLVIAALSIAALVVIAVNPLLWLEYERRWTGIDHSGLITDRSRYTATIRVAAILAIAVFVAFVLGVINFESVLHDQGTVQRQVIEQEFERDRERRESHGNRPGLKPLSTNPAGP